MTLIVLDEAEMEFLEAVLMKSVVAAKAVLFPEAEEKTISAAGAYWRMLSSSPRIGALKSSSIWKASNTKITASRSNLDPLKLALMKTEFEGRVDRWLLSRV